MSKPQLVANGLYLQEANGVVVKNDSSSDESSSSSSSTVKNSSDSSSKSDTSCKDTDEKKSSPDSSCLSNMEETDTEEPSASYSGNRADVGVQAEPIPQAAAAAAVADSYLSDHTNYADNEDSCSTNVMKYQTLLEHFRTIQKPREVDIGRVLDRRRRRRRSASEYSTGRNSPKERFEQRRKQKRNTLAGEPYPRFRVHYSESSQASAISDTTTETTGLSDWFPASESINFRACGSQIFAPAAESSRAVVSESAAAMASATESSSTESATAKSSSESAIESSTESESALVIGSATEYASATAESGSATESTAAVRSATESVSATAAIGSATESASATVAIGSATESASATAAIESATENASATAVGSATENAIAIGSSTIQSAFSLDHSTAETPDKPQGLVPPSTKDSNPAECSSSNEASQGARRKIPLNLPSTSRDDCTILSPLPTTPEEPESPSLYASYVVLAESLEGGPHHSRVNSLAALTEQLVNFSNHMEENSILSMLGLSPSEEPGAESASASAPLLVHAGRHSTAIRELEADLRRSCNELEKKEGVNEEENCNVIIKKVRHLRDVTRLETDEKCYFTHRGTIAPPSENPVSIEEIRETLPGIWDTMLMNNQMMTQWAYTVLDWCLQDTPECHPQHFYDAEAGVRALYREVIEVHRLVHNLLFRWRSRSMASDELGALTLMSTMSGHALTLYSTLESEVVNIRFNLGVRIQQLADSAKRQRTESEDTLSTEHDTPESKKSKKE